jgi:hypothetical protein
LEGLQPRINCKSCSRQTSTLPDRQWCLLEEWAGAWKGSRRAASAASRFGVWPALGIRFPWPIFEAFAVPHLAIRLGTWSAAPPIELGKKHRAEAAYFSLLNL